MANLQIRTCSLGAQSTFHASQSATRLPRRSSRAVRRGKPSPLRPREEPRRVECLNQERRVRSRARVRPANENGKAQFPKPHAEELRVAPHHQHSRPACVFHRSQTLAPEPLRPKPQVRRAKQRDFAHMGKFRDVFHSPAPLSFLAHTMWRRSCTRHRASAWSPTGRSVRQQRRDFSWHLMASVCHAAMWHFVESSPYRIANGDTRWSRVAGTFRWRS